MATGVHPEWFLDPDGQESGHLAWARACVLHYFLYCQHDEVIQLKWRGWA